MKLSLLVLTPGKMQGKVLDIKLSQFLIGRDPQCHLRPASPLISKRHCAILQRDGKVYIRDFESTNGTEVNGEPINGECELHHDDQLKVGPLLFTVRMEADAPAAKATAGKTPPPATRPTPRQTPTPATATPPPPKASAKPTSAPTTSPAAPGKKPATPTPAASGSSESSGSPPTGKKGSSGDDDLMAMLLSMQDDGPSSEGNSGEGEPAIPDGSTVHDLKLPEGLLDKPPEPGAAGTPPKDDKAKKASSAAANTSAAAASILQKMTRRTRS